MDLGKQSRVVLREIELPSEELAEELQRHLQDRRFTGATYDKAHKTIHFPDNMGSSQWSILRSTVEKWAKGRRLEVVESLKLQPLKPEATQAEVNPKEVQEEVKKRLEGLTPQKAEERYNYLQSRPISELTDAEIEERLALAQRKPEKN
jgi:hypothetical protein